ALKAQQDFDKILIEIELASLLDSKPNLTRACRLLRPKTMAYWTDIFPHLNDESEYNNFKSHFRIRRSTFNQLLSVLHQHPNYAFTPFQPQIPLEMQVAVVIQRFEPYGISSIGANVQQVIEGFAPPEFGQRIPNVIGAVYGTHIPIQHDTESFTYIYSGQPGSVHDARAFKQSDFWEEVMKDVRKRFSDNTHLLGDSAFSLMPWLLVPFKESGRQRLTHAQKRYNRAHSSARMAVERAFGKLKARWRILKNGMKVIDSTAVDITDVCCILHNLCINCCDFWETAENTDGDDDINSIDSDISVDVYTTHCGETKRNQLVSQFSHDV
ncbi:3112_t:CDS:2, partial [Paraglomus occultum]